MHVGSKEIREFVAALKRERDSMLEMYAADGGGPPKSHVGGMLHRAELSDEQRTHVMSALDSALTDVFVTLLYGLDGAASLGGEQKSYRLTDENGHLISDGTGDLEAITYEYFYGDA